jgi:predicted nucleic acid-binding protein
MPYLLDTNILVRLANAAASNHAVAAHAVFEDARVVAAAHRLGITHVLTFNTSHFARLAGFAPGVTFVDPVSI